MKYIILDLKQKNTTPIVGSGIIHLGKLIKAFIGNQVIISVVFIYEDIIVSFRNKFLDNPFSFCPATNVFNISPNLVGTWRLFISYPTQCFRVNITWCVSNTNHIVYLLSSFVKELFGLRIQSKPLYILSHTLLKTNVYAYFLLNLWLKSIKKTCQVHFFEVEANLKKLSYAFCSILLILSVKNYLYQTISVYPALKE